MPDARTQTQPLHKINPAWFIVATGETIGQFTCVSFTSSGTARTAKSTDTATLPAIGISITSGNITATNPVLVLLEGYVTNSAWSFTPGGQCFITSTGALTQSVTVTPGESIQYIGEAVTANTVYVKPELFYVTRS